MIDLSARAKELYSIRLEDGKILKLKKPTQSLLMKMMEFSSFESAPESAIPYLFEILTEVFNRNTEGRKFTAADIEEMLDIEVAAIILEDYLKTTVKQLGE